jgi:hypothetical protein
MEIFRDARYDEPLVLKSTVHLSTVDVKTDPSNDISCYELLQFMEFPDQMFICYHVK